MMLIRNEARVMVELTWTEKVMYADAGVISRGLTELFRVT